MKRLLAIALFLLCAVTASASLPVSRTFNGVTGNIPTADETQWAYNRSGASNFQVVSDGNGTYAGASDPTADTAMHWTGDTFADSHCSTVVLNVISTNGSGVGRGYGVIVRADTATTQKTGVRWVTDSHGWEMVRFNNGTPTILTSDTAASALGDSIQVCVQRVGANDVLSMKKNGTHLVNSPYTDTSPLTGGAPGIAHSSTTSSGTGQGIDSWTGSNLGGRSIGPIIFQ